MANDLILFIHGLGGSGKETWGKFPELIKADEQLGSQYDLNFYDYPTSLFRLPFFGRIPKIQELSSGLRTQVNNKFAAYDSIVLVCHSLGGLIARKYLAEEISNNKPLRTKKLVLYDVPNNGAGLASIGNYISWSHNQLAQLCRSSDLIEFLNEDWFRLSMPQHLTIKYVIAARSKVVDTLSAKLFWGNPDIETIVDKGHIDIVKPKDSSDMAFTILKNILTDRAQVKTVNIGIEDVTFLSTANDNELCMELVVANKTHQSVFFSRTKIEGALRQWGFAHGDWLAKLHCRVVLRCSIDGPMGRAKLNGIFYEDNDKYGYEFIGSYEYRHTGTQDWKIYLDMPTRLSLPANDKAVVRFIFERPSWEVLEESNVIGPRIETYGFSAEFEVVLYTDDGYEIRFSNTNLELIKFIANSIALRR